MTISHQLDYDTYVATQEKYMQIANFSQSGTGSLSYTIEPFGTAGAAFGTAMGGNPLGIHLVNQNCGFLY